MPWRNPTAGGGERPAAPIEDRGLDEKRDELFGEPVEHLDGEVVDEVAVAAWEDPASWKRAA